MFQRSIKLSDNHSFFLFGARGTGKSTLLKHHFHNIPHLYIDLLHHASEARYWNNPDLLENDILRSNAKWVVIDEVQKIPKLLDVVHLCIEKYKTNFALTGSSARKLKRGGANLLAGRAFVKNLFPLSTIELGEKISANELLQWGSLPKIFSLKDERDKIDFLESYTHTYLKEEVIAEQLVRKVEGFRQFLEISAQMNGKSLNFLKISRDCGVDSKTIYTFYQILEDTLIGFWLPAFHRSIRKSQKSQPKFYFFDLGVLRSLDKSLGAPVSSGNSAYGFYFETFLINEIFRLNSYSRHKYELHHYQTSGGAEIDLVLTRGKETKLIEIKSTTQIDPVEVEKFARITKDFKSSERYFISQDPIASMRAGVNCLFWRQGLKELFPF